MRFRRTLDILEEDPEHPFAAEMAADTIKNLIKEEYIARRTYQMKVERNEEYKKKLFGSMKYIPDTPEEREKRIRVLDLMYYELCLRLIKFFHDSERYDLMERVKHIYKYYKMISNIKDKERLEGQGNSNSIMFIGLNPGEASNLKNVWDDPYGRYFGTMLKTAGISTSSVWVTNLYKKKTEGNRPLTGEEIKAGWRELYKEIQFVDPTIIVALGKQVREVFKIEAFCWGQWKKYKIVGLPHPSFINRRANEEVKSRFMSYLATLKQYEQAN